MVKAKVFGAVAVLGLVSACTSIKEIRSLGTPTGGTAFTQSLAREYRDLALFEEDEMFDHIDATHFARKGLAAASGQVVAPADPAEWDLTADFRKEAVDARGRLVKALEGARTSNSAVAARAQVKYDCWIEQNEENFQFDHIAACRDQFFSALKVMEQRPAAPAAASAPVAAMAPKPAQPAAGPLTFICFFDFNSATVDNECKETVKLVKEEVGAGTGRSVALVGHTDTSGVPTYNMGLSLRRADNVVREMAGTGISRSIITATAKGEDNPRKATGDGVKERENRRVEITVK